MCIVNKYANIYLQKVYIVMSCLCDFLKLTIADRPSSNRLNGVITSKRDVGVRLVVLSEEEMICGERYI